MSPRKPLTGRQKHARLLARISREARAKVSPRRLAKIDRWVAEAFAEVEAERARRGWLGQIVFDAFERAWESVDHEARELRLEAERQWWLAGERW